MSNSTNSGKVNPVNSERELLSKIIQEEIIPSCCNGNKAAEAYLKRMFFIVRLLDDIQDEDYKVEKSDIIKGYFLLLGDIATNKFYKEHQDMLIAIHIVSFNAWQDSNSWENDISKTKRLYAHVIRDYICELFSLVAYLNGGEKLMRKVSIKIRSAFVKEIGE